MTTSKDRVEAAAVNENNHDAGSPITPSSCSDDPDGSYNRLFVLMKRVSIVLALITLSSAWIPSLGFTSAASRLVSTTAAATLGTLSSSSLSSASPSNDSTATRTKTTTDTTMPSTTPLWFQKGISITAPSRGCHLITNDVLKAVGDDMRRIDVGLANLFVQHTSASLTINENADPDVRSDMEVALNKMVPAQWCRDGTFRHTMEGDDDMPGHVKSSVMGVSLNIPIKQGRLALGTWQGIYLNEHRDSGGWGGGHNRHIVITLQGQGKA